MLPSTCSREALLAGSSCPPWNLFSFTVESTLSTPCARSDPPLSRQGAALAYLDSLSHFMIWFSGQTALFLFLLARAALAYLPTALCVALRPSFLLSQTLWQIWQDLSSPSSCSFRLQWVSGHSFLPGNDTADKLARRGAKLAPSAIPCSLSPLVSTLVFSRT